MKAVQLAADSANLLASTLINCVSVDSIYQILPYTMFTLKTERANSPCTSSSSLNNVTASRLSSSYCSEKSSTSLLPAVWYSSPSVLSRGSGRTESVVKVDGKSEGDTVASYVSAFKSSFGCGPSTYVARIQRSVEKLLIREFSKYFAKYGGVRHARSFLTGDYSWHSDPRPSLHRKMIQFLVLGTQWPAESSILQDCRKLVAFLG